jgi:hypothetical protein
MEAKTEIPEWLFVDHAKEIEALLSQAVKRVVWEHKQLGLSISTIRDGQVVIIPPEDIDVDAPSCAAPTKGAANDLQV